MILRSNVLYLEQSYRQRNPKFFVLDFEGKDHNRVRGGPGLEWDGRACREAFLEPLGDGFSNDDRSKTGYSTYIVSFPVEYVLALKRDVG